MKISLKKKTSVLLFAFVIILNVISVYMNYRNYKASNEDFNYTTANTLAETCSLIIDSDAIANYITTLRRDNSYYETWNKLIDYRNTNKDIVKLAVVYYDEKGCHYIFDTDLTKKGAFLGDYRDYDAKELKIKKELMDANNFVTINYNSRTDFYRPLLSSYNMPVGYVVVGISTIDAIKQEYTYLVQLIFIMSLVSAIIAFVFTRWFSRLIVNPINKLSEATHNYVNTMDVNADGVSPLSRLTIKTGDEIERLFLSIRKMEEDLLNFANDLSVARWNSNHDSMTKLYNKRYLQECKKRYTEPDSVAAFFFDVDNLKKMNDICGHDQGDEVICKTAEFVKKYLPESGGYGFRIGGDEFLLLLFGTNRQETEALFAAMQADPAKQLTPIGSIVECRIATGYAFKKKCTDLEALIEKADQKMYADKHSHR